MRRLFAVGVAIMLAAARDSEDSGRSWEEVGGLPAGQREVTTGPKGDLYAVLPGGELVRSTDTGANWMNIGTAG